MRIRSSSNRVMRLLALWLALCALAVGLVTATAGGTGAASHKRHKRQGNRLWHNTGLWSELGVPRFWEQHDDGPYGIVIRGWRFAKCASEQWTNYKIDIQDLTIWPQYPRFPGPIFYNITGEIKEELPQSNIEVELEIRQLVQNKQGQKIWQVIPCQGWDLLTGCDGVGSCRYCDVLDQCKKTVATGHKHATDDKVRQFLKTPDKICPPPKGSWTMQFSRSFSVEEIPKGIFGPLQSNQYWLSFTFTDGRGGKLACARVWIDFCKYHLYDPQQRCLRDPNAMQKFLNQLSAHQETNRG